MKQQKIAIAIHGGAGTIEKSLLSPALEISYKTNLQKAAETGYAILQKGGSATDAVAAAVVFLENCPLFNAGKGAVFNHIGKHEMDAAIMEGKNLMAGAVSGIKNIKNPVMLAKTIMQESQHVMMAGDGAEVYAKQMGCEFQADDYFFTEHRFQQWQAIKDSDNYQLDHTAAPQNKMGTVGAVALDENGNIAAATSTGGMTNKKYGRVGDSPIIGAGTYANNQTCAISCTGHGELFIRSVVAYDISCLMAYKKMTLQQACNEVVMKKLVDIKGEGGLVAIDAQGNIQMPFNSEGMYRASINTNNELLVEIY